MQHPAKWRATADPFALPYRSFEPVEVLGYPHAGNDVFQMRGLYRGRMVEAYVKVARRSGAGVCNELAVLAALECPLAPEVIDYDARGGRFLVTLAKPGERLSTILQGNPHASPCDYLPAYGRALARLHGASGAFPAMRERQVFCLRDGAFFADNGLEDVRAYLLARRPPPSPPCFCHGDFHYANLLWEGGRLSGILDFELAGMGDPSRDIAWALLRRPGQAFLDTPGQIDRFLDGYGKCDRAAVRWWMVQFYTWYYDALAQDAAYRAFVRGELERLCAL